MALFDRRSVLGTIRRNEIAAYYEDILPLLLEWSEEQISQEEMAGRLNRMGKLNSYGKPYNQAMISRIIKRAQQLGQLPETIVT